MIAHGMAEGVKEFRIYLMNPITSSYHSWVIDQGSV
jgi:hypothetical protein